jgi:membrane protein implicated in regulation of membrane protease activity
MTWSDFYLICFILGSTLSLVSFLSGAHVHLPFHIHFPHGWFHGGHGAGHTHASASDSSIFNFATIMAFLAWFGAMGYLLSRYYRWWSGAILVAALLTGFAGGAVIYFFFVKLFVENEHPLRASDFDMVGVLGHLSVPIQGTRGTGELIYSQEGTRRSCGARSEDGATVAKGTEVVVLRYVGGVAYVRPLTELEEGHGTLSVS